MIIPITGPAYKHPSTDVNNQRCVNMFVMSPGPEGRGKATLVPTAGLSQLTDLSGLTVRDMRTMGSYVYVVVDNSVKKLSINTTTLAVTTTTLGTLGSSTGVVHSASNPTQIMWVDGTTSARIYIPVNTGTATVGIFGGTAADTYSLTINGTAIYTNENVATALTLTAVVAQINTLTGTTGVTASGTTAGGIITLTHTGDTTITVTESGTGFVAGTDGITKTGGDFAAALPAFRTITDTDFVGGSHVEFIDGYFVVNKPDSAIFQVSAINDGTRWDALDVATAESDTDQLVALGAVKGELWLIGEQSVEIWYNAANVSGSPFSARTGLELRIGCGAKHSVAKLNDLLIWLDNRGFIVQSDLAPFVRNNNTGYALTIISDEAITAEILSYSTRDDAIGMAYNDRGHLMYQITFPTAEKTWVYDYTTKLWHERRYTLDAAHLGQFYTQFSNLSLTGGNSSGIIYLMSDQYYDDAGTAIRRIRTTAPQSNEFNLFGIDKFELRMETGQALQSGDGSDPQVRLRVSLDGGHSWSNEMVRSMGLVGQYNKNITWNRLGVGREWVFELSISEPIKFSIIDASISVAEVET
jgi:hypothetical protein